MTINFVRYNTTTGAILGFGELADEAGLPLQEALYPDDGFVADRGDPDTQYVDLLSEPPAVVARPTFAITTDKTSITADGADTATISGIPAGTLVTLLASDDFGEASEVINSGSTTITTVHKVPHILRFNLFPYADHEVIINGV